MSEYDKTAQGIVDVAGDCPTPLHWGHTKRWLKTTIATALTAAVAAERERTDEWKERALRAEAEAMTLRDIERSRNTVNRQTKAEAEL